MGYIYAIAAAITWGFVYAIDQKILDKVSATSLILMQYLFAILILLPITLYKNEFRKEILSLDKSGIWFLILSFTFSLLASYLIFIAIQRIGSPKAAIFEIAYPLFVVLFSAVLFQAQMNLYFLLGAALLFIGSAIIITLG